MIDRVPPRRCLRVCAGLLAAACLLEAVVQPGSLTRSVATGTMVLDRNGQTLRLATAADGRYRLWMDLDEYSPELVEAVLAKEDRNFWWHPGVDPPALANAAWHSLALRDYRAGASTVTMQAARLVWRLDTDNLPGKLVQIGAALYLSAFYSKRQVLELYLNLAPCGGNVEGFGTASRIYFGKPPSRLNFAESLTLAVLPQDPARRNPADPASLPAILKARGLLFGQMAARRPELRGRALDLDLPLAFRRELPFLAPQLCDRLLAEHPGSRRVRASVDAGVQAAVERQVAQFARRGAERGVDNACALLVRASDMAVLASVGSADFFDPAIQGQVDGVRARRSPGSALKPFIYALAMEQGLVQPLSVLKDTRVHFGGYNPDNFDDDFLGPVSAADALILSRNVPAVALAGRLRDPDLYEFLQNAGVDLPYPRGHYGLSLVLGGAEVSMEDLVCLYGALARSGVAARPVFALDVDRRPLDGGQRGRRLLRPESAWLARQILAAKPRPDRDGTYLDGMDRIFDPDHVAYKTGTSIGFRDAWSVGMFDGLVLAVWVGNFDNRPNPEFVGLRCAAPLMFDIVDALRLGGEADAYRDRSPPAQPEGVIRTELCRTSGMLATPLCRDRVLAYFLPGVSSIEPCSVHRQFEIDLKSGLRRSRAIPGKTRPEVFEIWPADVMAVFAEAGLGRRAPPPWDPADRPAVEEAPDNAPGIVSPIRGMSYYFDVASADERIPLVSSVASDSRTVWWFVDGKLVGSVAGRSPLYWKPEAGRHEVRVVDDQNRQAAVRFAVFPRN